MVRVLVIEDEAPVRRGIQRTLERAGYEVHTAGTSTEALGLIGVLGFDVALVDYELPGGSNGVSLLQSLQQAQPACARVLVSGHIDLPVAIDAVNQGEIHHVVKKPFRALQLMNAVEQSRAGLLRQAASIVGTRSGQTDERRMLEECLDSRDFQLALQPIVDTDDGAAVGFEGLIRTGHPVLDGPRSVLRMAQRHQMVPEVGSAVAARAVRWMGDLPAEAGLFINLHPDEFADSGALSDRLAPLEPWKDRVILEITGEAMEKWPGTFSTKMRRIRDQGFSIAIDDIGSGHSALFLMAETDPSFIKADIGIVRGVDRCGRKRRLVDLISKFADAAGAGVVAEGVETESEATTLRESGVTLMQGFLFGKPGFFEHGRASKALPRPEA